MNLGSVLRRSPRELAARLRQESDNVRLLLLPPRQPPAIAPTKVALPPGQEVATALRETAYAAGVQRLAAEIRAHRFPLLGLIVETGPDIHWRRDYLSGLETPPAYFRRIPYLDPARAGDHKIIWELNRHQHLVLLAQAWLFDNNRDNLTEIERQLASWWEQNPFQRGINWASALEVAFRALSWIWIYHLCGSALDSGITARLLHGVLLHARHLETNLSYYFSPNTHLLGEAVALHAIGALFPQLPHAERWRTTGARVVEQQMERQVRDDGSHFEQSTYYHVYALDMFLFHAVIARNISPAYREKLARMAEFLYAVEGPSRRLPFLGDDDGGRFFHPYGARERFGNATLACVSALLAKSEWAGTRENLEEIAAWWLGPPVLAEPASEPAPFRSHLFPDSGLVIMIQGDRHVIAEAGPFGPGASGHSHSDTLSIVVRNGPHDVLLDPGTFTYMGADRNWFRGSAAHSTIRIDGLDQAAPVNAFRWADQPRVSVREWRSAREGDYLDAVCEYRGFAHHRRVWFATPGLLLIADEILGPQGDHLIEQFWHRGDPHARCRLIVEGPSEVIPSWASHAFGEKHESTAIRVARRGPLPVRLAAVVILDAAGEIAIEQAPARTRFHWKPASNAPPQVYEIESIAAQ